MTQLFAEGSIHNPADRDKLGLSEEVARLFDSRDPDVERALAALRGETPSA